ncbi:hypothetical protein GCM10020001_031510 [Nonomuraea salmonea]
MPIETTTSVVTEVPDDAELLAVPYDSDLSPSVELPLPAAGLLAHYDAKGEAGEIVEVPVARSGGVGRVLLYGVGDGSPRALRTAAAALTRKAKGRDTLTVVPPAGDLTPFAEAALLAAYTFRIGKAGKKPVGTLVFAGADEGQVRRAETVARAVAFARDLANTPSSVKNPAWLAEQAQESGVPVEVWDEERLKADGFGGILAVGQGSASPPRLIKLTYTPRRAGRAARRAGGQGHHVRLGRAVAQADRQHEDPEDRHGGRRGRHRGAQGAGRAQGPPYA